MKSLLLEKKSKFILYVMACFLPVITQLMQIGVVALIFETVERNSMTFFWNAVFLAAVFLVLSTLFYITSRMMRISYMRDVLLSLRIKAFDNIMSMSYKQFNKKSRDVYVSHLINDINTFESSFFISLINFIFRCGLYISVLIILAFVNWIIALVVFGLSLTLFLVSMIYGKKTVKMQKQVSVANEEFTTDVSNTFTGLEILKLNNIEAIFLKKNHDQIAKLESRKFKFNIFTAFQLYSNVTIGFIFFMGLLVYLMYLTKDGLGFGEIVLTIQLSSSALFPLVTMMPLINILKSSKAIYEKITKTDEEADLNHKDKPFVFKNRIDLDQVSFGYENQMLFKSTSFSIEKGKKYLVKGPSGSG
ncbi:MAG: ABC transporter ATP-binding protein, partial [Acholeplasmataceae bacterium]|nr:ABC transporter ATP-binding protein [Acholeplasmataceae bacterium]